jgi:2-polyprenyl-3-methyl-5-hydroxy-6-metoxy-1,4-benzoquinol methylase
VSRRGSGPDPFDRDIEANGGYRYTTNAGLSSRLANERQTQATLALVDLAGQSVIDVGCGDGTYTAALAAQAAPLRIVGLDPAARAIAAATSRYPELRFEIGGTDWLESTDERFDVAIVRGVLHHADDPERLVRAVANVARQIVVIEANGLNPVLKAIERLSPYHRAHAERSFSAALINRWLRSASLTIGRRQYVGLVPLFVPAPAARILKTIEPVMEHLFGVRCLALGTYCVRADARAGAEGSLTARRTVDEKV